MSLCSCSSCSTISLQRSESSNSYRLLSSSSSSSITTVSSPSDNQRRNSTTDDDEKWPAPPVDWRIEKTISLNDQQSNKNTCILKATMTEEQIVICDSSSTRSTIIPGKHISMKVVFKF